MNEQSKKILEMLEAGKINAAEATKLLEALNAKNESEELITEPDTNPTGKARWLKVFVKKANSSKPEVNIKIPLSVAKLALKLGGKVSKITPNHVKEELNQKGISLDDLDELKNLDEIIDSLSAGGKFKLVEVDDGDERVEVTIE